MRKVNQTQFAARQQRIREAALACFKRAGFHRASMADICAEAAMSPGNVYRYYPNKEAIIEAICEHDREQVTRRFEAMHQSGNLLEAMLEIAGEAMAASHDREKSKVDYEILAEAMRNERIAAIVERHAAALLAICTEAIARAQALNLVDPGLDAGLAAVLLIGAAEGLGIRLAIQPQLDPRRSIELFKLLIARFLRPQP